MITTITSALPAAAAWALLHSLWQFTFLAALLALALACIRESVRLRYLLSFATLLLMPLLLIATTAYLLPPAPIAATPQPLAAAPVSLDLTSTPSAPIPLTSGSPAPAPSPSWQSHIDAHASLILTAYLAGAAVCLLRLALGSTYLLRLRRSSSPAVPALQASANRLAITLRLSRPVRLLQSPHIDSPSVLGIWRPLILIPTSALTRISVPELETLLAHELAHIRRHDHLANLLQSLLEAALFYHPALWWLSARIRQEREHCCDDIAIALTGNPAAYAHALASLESLRALPNLALSARTGNLLPRIHRIALPPRAAGAPNAAQPLSPAILAPAAADSLAAAINASKDSLRLDLSAPAVTVFNWQNGFIAQTTSRNFVDRWNPPAFPDSKPTMHVATINAGTVLEIQPVITLKPQPAAILHVTFTLRQLLGVDNFASPDVPDAKEYMIQIPRLTETRIATVLTVPDHQTLLLGGSPVTGEIQLPNDKKITLTTPHYLYLTLTPILLIQHEMELPTTTPPTKSP